MTTATTSTLTPNNPWLFGLGLVLSLAGLWLSPYPPLVDFPQHAAQIVTLQELWSGNSAFTGTFEINWFAPYTATYLLFYSLALVLPVGLAGKLLISLAVAAIPVITWRLLQAAGSEPGWSWLTIPASLSVSFYWGFMPFLLATAVGLYLLLQTLRFGHDVTLGRGIGIALCTVLLFFCHVMALGCVALVALVYLAVLHYGKPRQILLSWLPYTAGLPFIVYWYVSTVSRESYVQGAGVLFGPLWDRLLTILTQLAGQGGTMQLPEILIGAALLALPFIAGARFSPMPARWAPFIVALTIVLLMPTKAFGSILLYQRLSVFLLPLLLLALEFPRQTRPAWGYVAMLVVALTAFTNINRFNAFNGETLGLSRLMTIMEERKNVLYIPVDPWESAIPAPAHFHTGVWYQVEKRGIVDFNFAFFFPSMVRFKEGAHSWIPNDSVVWRPLAFEWDARNGAHYDYFVVYARNDMTDAIFKGARDRVELVENVGWWWLYRKVAQ